MTFYNEFAIIGGDDPSLHDVRYAMAGSNHLIIFMLVALISLVMGACDGSEAYYTVDGQKIPASPVGGKGDSPVPLDLPLAPELLSFPQDGSPLTLDASQVATRFGERGVTIRHSTPLQGLIISWDGSSSEVYARSRSGQGSGTWAQAESTVEQEGSFRVRYETAGSADFIDLYFMSPDGISFMIIEPVMP